MSKPREKSAKNRNADEQPNANPAASITTSDLLQAIESLKTDLKQDNVRMSQENVALHHEISGKLDTITEDVRGLSSRVDEVESRVARVEDLSLDLAQAFSQSIKRQRGLQDKLTDLESRSRRNNIRIFGVDEREKPQSMENFVTELFRRELQLPPDYDLKIQRAHRVSARRPSATPRPIIVNFQEFTVKEKILREAWKKRGTQLNGRNIYFDHDYASEVVQKRMEYRNIKKALKERNIRFQTPYTSMRIHWEDGTTVYSTARAAGLELRKRGMEVEVPAATNDDDAEAWLQRLQGWQRQGRSARGDAPATAAQRAKEKLKDFQRSEGD